MTSDDAPVHGRSGTASVARQWAGALGRLIAFGALFVSLVEIIGVLTYPVFPHGSPWAVAVGGAIWLGAALLAGAIALRFFDRRSWRALGLVPRGSALRQTLLGFGLGIAMIVVAVALMLATRDLMFGSDAGSASGAARTMGESIAVLAPAAAAEEALFRGYPIQVLARAAGAPLAVITTSVAFAGVHASNPSVGPLALTNIFLAGLLLGAVYLRSGSLWAATALHLGWNWGMGGLFDLPVSGLGWIDVPGFEPWISGPAWWNGGQFGPEGGVIGTIVFVGATVFVLRSRWFERSASVPPQDRLLCDRRSA